MCYLRILVTAAVLVSALPAFAEPAERVASVASFTGDVQVKRAATGQTEKVTRPRTPLFAKDEVATGSQSDAKVLFADGSRIDLGAESNVVVDAQNRQREITVTRGSLKSDIKKLPGMTTEFRTPAGVAAVKGTLVECVVKSEGKIEISADLGLLTHQVKEMNTGADLSQGRRLEIGLDRQSGAVDAKSLVGDIDLKTKELTTLLKKEVAVRTKLDGVAEKVCLSVQSGSAQTKTTRETTLMLDQGDMVDFVRTCTGIAVTVVKGEVAVIDASGSRMVVKAGETAVELPSRWLEPETPEGNEAMVPPVGT